MRHLSWRDWLATAFVAAAGVLYVVWLARAEVFGVSGPRAVTVTVFALGLAASVTAVVYGVGAGLLQANKVYLAITGLLGLAALVTGSIAFVAENEAMLAALVASTTALWLMSTVRHGMGATEPRTGGTEIGGTSHAAV
jgi:hypothetical protein